MEAVAKILDREIPLTIAPTGAAFMPLLEKQRTVIESVTRQTFDFGTHPRNKVDVYYPPTAPSDASAKTPILFWIYGGGYSTGDRSLPQCNGLVYNNIGAYFTQRGFIVAIPDYRLVPEVVFPASAKDVRDAILWLTKNASTALVSPTSPNPDVDNLIIMGHSAGATHTATMLFHPELLPVDGSGPEGAKELRQRIRAAVLVSGPHEPVRVVPHQEGHNVHTAYWEGAEKAKLNHPRPLYERTPEDLLRVQPHILLVEGQWEPDWILAGQAALQNAILKKEGKHIKKITAMGHNHISLSLAVLSGEGEEWLEQVLEWHKGLN